MSNRWMRRVKVLFLVSLMIFCSVPVFAQIKGNSKSDTTYSILGTWKVVKAMPSFDYKEDRDAQKEADAYLGEEVIFKKDSITSNIDQVGNGPLGSGNFSTISHVSYVYSIDSSVNEYGTSLSLLKYYRVNSPTVTFINGAFLNTYTNRIDSFYFWMNLLNKDTLNISFHVITLFLKRMSREVSLQIIPPVKSVVKRPLTKQELLAQEKEAHQEYVDSINETNRLDSLFTLAFKHIHPYNIWTNAWNVYDGKMGNDSIELSVYSISNGETKGNYFYYAYKKRIRLYGETHGNKMDLVELANGKPNGYFKLDMISGDTCTGYWMSKDKSVKLPIKMHVESQSESYYWPSVYGSPIEVEAFAGEVKKNILDGNKEWVADHIYYPIEVQLDGTKDTEIADKEQFIRDFDRIFYKKYVDKIRQAPTFNLSHNDSGVLLDDGKGGDAHLYIDNTPGSTKGHYGFCISAIDN